VRWHRLGEVENVYVAYNFSHFAIFLPTFIKIDGNSTKFQKKTKMLFFSETRCISAGYKCYVMMMMTTTAMFSHPRFRLASVIVSNSWQETES